MHDFGGGLNGESASPTLAEPGMQADAPRSRGGRRPGAGRKTEHGYRKMRATLTALTTRRLDGRSAVAVAVRKWKGQVAADLGGALSEAQETILEGAAQKLIIRDSLADYIARQASLVTKKRVVIAVVGTYLTAADSLSRDLERLGLSRVERDANVVAELAALHQVRR